jgi:hypothetical protein
MTLRHVTGAFTATVLTCGLLTALPAHAQTRDGGLLPPDQSGVITVAGCLQLGGKDGDEYVLAIPTPGPIANVPVETCKAAVDERALDLKDTEDFGFNPSMIGRWIEVSGTLERETDSDLTNLREIEIRSFRLLPVVPPPAPPVRLQSHVEPVAPLPEPIPVEEPVGTTGVEPALPQTASPLVPMGLLGLFSLAGAVGLHTYRLRGRG